MSDEAPAVATEKRRGRPPKKRHDPDDAPITGAQTDERIHNPEPGYKYMWASDEDIPEMYSRGADVCNRGTEQAKPYYDLRRDTGESEIKYKGLTLMKIRTELDEKAQGRGRAIAAQRMAALRRQATGQIGGGQFASINENFSDGGYHRQVI